MALGILHLGEEALVEELRVAVDGITLSVGGDTWEWLPENGGCFTVKSTYLLLRSLCQPHLSKSPLKLYVYRNLWKSWAPMKVSTLSWQLLLDRLPMKFNLHRRGIIPQVDSPKCVCVCAGVLCGNSSKQALHLFLHCNFVSAVWYEVFHWLVVVQNIPSGSVSLGTRG